MGQDQGIIFPSPILTVFSGPPGGLTSNGHELAKPHFLRFSHRVRIALSFPFFASS